MNGPAPRPPASRPDPADRPPLLPPWLPVATVALGVLLIAVTVRGAGGLDHGPADGLAHDLRPPAAIGAAFALVVVASTFAKHRDDGYGVLRRAGTACGVLLGAAALLVPLGLLMLGRRRGPLPLPPKPTSTGKVTGPTESQTGITLAPTEQPGKAPAHWWTTLAGFTAAAVITAIVVLVVVVVVNVLKRNRIRLGLGPSAQFGGFDDADELADAVAAAAEALEDGGETREAVIACYAAMETSITEAGVGRRSSDTPEDLLKRATAAGLVPVGAGTRLTELFREARFSRHPMTENHRVEARSALAEISIQVAERRRATRPAAGAGVSA